MFNYLRCPSKKKPMHELDQDAYFSPLHPKGDALKELLELGQKYKVVRKQRADANTEAQSSVPSVRSQFGVAFKWVTEKNLSLIHI